ncbi:MAG TPA: flagellar export chaperone FliS [Bryobacteraceae bacterium]|nr:flagellar export chaperone FliS [Bryobacteraceae bacterium]
MLNNPYAAHIEASVLTAEPVELVRTLYRGALAAVGDARACVVAGDVAGRSAAVSKAVNILRELAFSLNPESEPGMARNLLELYDYMQRRLLAAHLERSEAPLVEVAGLLGTLAEAWDRVEVPPAADTALMQQAG